jgi:hypothetical protein
MSKVDRPGRASYQVLSTKTIWAGALVLAVVERPRGGSPSRGAGTRIAELEASEDRMREERNAARNEASYWKGKANGE